MLTGGDCRKKSSRWPELLPEKRGDAPGGSGLGEGHGGTQRIAANPMEGAALPGVPPDDGAVVLLLELRRAQMCTSRLSYCAQKSNKGMVRCARGRGSERSQKEWRGRPTGAGILGERRRARLAPTSNCGRDRRAWARRSRGKRRGELGL